MNRYKILKALGDGTYGSVLRAQEKSTGEIVAIKKFKQKYRSWEECMKLREIAALRKLVHPNIVKLKEVIRENDELHLVFEHMENNLYEFTKGRGARLLPESKVRNMMFQIYQGLFHVHKNGYFHRDLKPENVLVRGDMVKLADFGLAREIRARPPFTDYVSTRWYRAPEALLRSSTYNSPLDLWACGGIMAELYTFRPLFPGSSEPDQLYKICTVIGTPSQTAWPDGYRNATQIGFRFPQVAATNLATLIPNASKEAVEVMYGCLQWDPAKRMSVHKCLQCPYFETGSLANANQEQAEQKLPSPSSQKAGMGGLRQQVQQALPQIPKAQPGQAGQKGFPGNFLLNNLNGTGHKEGTAASRRKKDGSQPSTGEHRHELPALPPQAAPSQSPKSGSSRYLRLARYQPGMEQQPAVANPAGNPARRDPLPDSPSLCCCTPSKQPPTAATPDVNRRAPRANIFGDAGSRMFT